MLALDEQLKRFQQQEAKRRVDLEEGRVLVEVPPPVEPGSSDKEEQNPPKSQAA